MPKEGKRKLSMKQKKFIEVYTETSNATKAAAVAYDTDDYGTQRAIGSENLTKPNIQAEIEERVKVAKAMVYTIATTGDKEETRLRACQDIIDRVEGKAKQHVEQTAVNVNVDWKNLSEDELDKLI